MVEEDEGDEGGVGKTINHSKRVIGSEGSEGAGLLQTGEQCVPFCRREDASTNRRQLGRFNICNPFSGP